MAKLSPLLPEPCFTRRGSSREAPGPALIEEAIIEVLRFFGPVKPRDDMAPRSLRREA